MITWLDYCCCFFRQLLYPVRDITLSYFSEYLVYKLKVHGWHVAAKKATTSQIFLPPSVRKIMCWNMWYHLVIRSALGGASVYGKKISVKSLPLAPMTVNILYVMSILWGHDSNCLQNYATRHLEITGPV